MSNPGSDRPSGRDWLARVRADAPVESFRILNVCGGHERAIGQAGLRAALPPSLDVIPGPGCPVCVCPEEDVHDAIRLAAEEDITVVAFGDMLDVPINVPRREPGSLAQARAAGADVRSIASPQQAVALAEHMPHRPIVFFAAGFETTMAPVAAMIDAGMPDNLFMLVAGRRTWPAVQHLLADGDAAFDALIAPGHVATIMGAQEWAFVPEQHRIPTAVAGFHAESLLAAIHAVITQHRAGDARLDNQYPEVVRPDGNVGARRVLEQVFEDFDANWRGIGRIPRSGFRLAPAHRGRDARVAFGLEEHQERRRIGEMPPGCDCARVVLGQIRPNECRLYGTGCRPDHPIGPCMVSDEGACRIWLQEGVREQGRP